MFTSTKLAELQAEITRLTAESSGFKAERDNLTAQLAEAMVKAGKVEGLETQITALTAEKTDLTGKLEAATGKVTDLEAKFDSKVEALVVERCAAAGVTPIARDPNQTEGSGETFDEKLKAARAIQDPTAKAKAIEQLWNSQSK